MKSPQSDLLLVAAFSLVTCEAERGSIVKTPIEVLTSLGENMRWRERELRFLLLVGETDRPTACIHAWGHFTTITAIYCHHQCYLPSLPSPHVISRPSHCHHLLSASLCQLLSLVLCRQLDCHIVAGSPLPYLLSLLSHHHLLCFDFCQMPTSSGRMPTPPICHPSPSSSGSNLQLP
jgi:hypothetical protein